MPSKKIYPSIYIDKLMDQLYKECTWFNQWSPCKNCNKLIFYKIGSRKEKYRKRKFIPLLDKLDSFYYSCYGCNGFIEDHVTFRKNCGDCEKNEGYKNYCDRCCGERRPLEFKDF